MPISNLAESPWEKQVKNVSGYLVFLWKNRWKKEICSHLQFYSRFFIEIQWAYQCLRYIQNYFLLKRKHQWAHEYNYIKSEWA